MVNENSGGDKDHALKEHLARHLEEFGLPASRESKLLKRLLFKSLMRHYPAIDLGAIQVVRAVSLTHALLMVSVEEHLRPADLSWSKLFILLWLRAVQDAGEEGLNPSELSGHLAVTRNTVSALLGGLEQQGYVTRDLDPQDKRRFVIRLKPAGSEATERCSAPLFHHLQHCSVPWITSSACCLLVSWHSFSKLSSRTAPNWQHVLHILRFVTVTSDISTFRLRALSPAALLRRGIRTCVGLFISICLSYWRLLSSLASPGTCSTTITTSIRLTCAGDWEYRERRFHDAWHTEQPDHPDWRRRER